MLVGTLVYRHGPRTGGSRTVLAGFAGRTSVGAFRPLSPTPMSAGPDTRASTRNKMGTKAIGAPGSDQNPRLSVPPVAVRPRRTIIHGVG
jgi:hypothetical protein